MSWTVRAASVALPLLALSAAHAAAQGPVPKLAFINSQQILSQAPGRSEAEAQFKRELDGYQTQVKRMGDSLRALIAAYDKQEVILSPAAKEAKQKEIQGKEKQFQDSTSKLEQRMSQREAELTRPILERINKVIEEIRQEEGYAFILDAGSSSGVVVAADKNLDITTKVLQRLQAQATAAGTQRAPGAPAQPAATGPVAPPSTLTTGTQPPPKPKKP